MVAMCQAPRCGLIYSNKHQACVQEAASRIASWRPGVGVGEGFHCHPAGRAIKPWTIGALILTPLLSVRAVLISAIHPVALYLLFGSRQLISETSTFTLLIIKVLQLPTTNHSRSYDNCQVCCISSLWLLLGHTTGVVRVALFCVALFSQQCVEHKFKVKVSSALVPAEASLPNL